MRTYTFLAGRAGRRAGFEFWPHRQVTATANICVVAIVLFEKWFGGRKPTFHWHMPGMAEARDNRGNFVQVEQWNHYHRWSPGATQMRRPLCPMVIKKGAKP